MVDGNESDVFSDAFSDPYSDASDDESSPKRGRSSRSSSRASPSNEPPKSPSGPTQSVVQEEDTLAPLAAKGAMVATAGAQITVSNYIDVDPQSLLSDEDNQNPNAYLAVSPGGARSDSDPNADSLPGARSLSVASEEDALDVRSSRAPTCCYRVSAWSHLDY